MYAGDVYVNLENIGLVFLNFYSYSYMVDTQSGVLYMSHSASYISNYKLVP